MRWGVLAEVGFPRSWVSWVTGQWPDAIQYGKRERLIADVEDAAALENTLM